MPIKDESGRPAHNKGGRPAEDESSSAGRDARPPRHRRSQRTHRVVRGVALGLIAVIAGTGGVAVALVHHLQGNITTYDTGFINAGDPQTPGAKHVDPTNPNAGHDINILVLGTDSRAGDNSKYVDDGNVGDQHSDTAMVMHISADRKRIDIVSIPRDSLVDIPACTLDAKKTVVTAPSHQLFNAAFQTGWNGAQAHGWSNSDSFGAGATCAWETVKQLTGVTIDGYIVIDFAGFGGMVDALGGVDVCTPTGFKPTKAGDIDLAPGWHKLQGGTALKYARARYSVADGTDLARIGRQQGFVGSMANEFFAKNFLTDSPSLVLFLNAATKALHTSKNIGSIPYMTGLAFSLRHLDSSNITFTTVPWHYDAVQKSHVDWTEPAASDLWAKLAADKPITPKKAPKPKSTTSRSTGTGTPSSKPSPKPSPTSTLVAAGGETGLLSAGSLPKTKAECDSLVAATQKQK